MQDSFFELGGDSIKAIRVVSILRNDGYTVTVKDIIGGKTPVKIANNLVSNFEFDHLNENSIQNSVRLFDMKELDDQTKLRDAEKFLADSIDVYKKNKDSLKIEKVYPPTFIQKYFYTFGLGQIIRSSYEVDEKISKDRLISALRRLIKEQSILRTAYDIDKSIMMEYSYSSEWFIPYFEGESVQKILSWLPVISGSKMLNGSEELQSFILVCKLENGKHIVTIYADHGIWDMFSSMIFAKRLNALVNDETLDETYRYSNYVASLVENKNDNNNIETFCNEYLEKSAEISRIIRNSNKQAYIASTSIILTDENKSRFNDSPMTSVLDLCYKSNPLFESLEYIPLLMVFHGRADADDNMTGIKLSVLPALYSIADKKISGGTLLLNSNNTVPSKILDEDFINRCYSSDNTVISYNNRAIFDGESHNDPDIEKNEVTIISEIAQDKLMREVDITCDVIDNTVFVGFPVYYDDAESAKSYIEKVINDTNGLFE